MEYSFEEEEHAKAFKGFEAKVGECLRANEDEAAGFLLRMLLDTLDMVGQLQTSVKHADCTFQRFYLLLMPLIAMAEEADYASTKEITCKFIEFLLESEYSLNIKVNALVQLYNSVHPVSGLKA